MPALWICVVLVTLGPVGASALDVQLSDWDLPGFTFPIDFALGPPGRVAVLEDQNLRVLIAGTRGTSEPLPGLANPKAMARDEEGLLLVLDTPSGSHAELVAFRGTREGWRVTLQGELRAARPVDTDARDGILWVVDQSPPRLFLYSYDGSSLGWVEMGEHARAPFSISLGPAGEAFVTDPMGPAVLAYSPTGSYLGGLNLDGTGVTRPTGVAADPTGRVWVSDGITGRVVCLDPAGEDTHVACAGRPLRFEDPLRIAWWDEALWVLEGRPGRVRRVVLEGP